MNPEDHLDFGPDRVHPAAKELLEDVIQRPRLYEALGEKAIARIEEIMNSQDYTKHDNGGGVTVGWNRKVDDPSTATSALIVCGDALMSLSLGSKGSYAFAPFVQSLQHPSDEELARFADPANVERMSSMYNLTPRGEEEIRKLHVLAQTMAQTTARKGVGATKETFLTRLRKMLGGR